MGTIFQAIIIVLVTIATLVAIKYIWRYYGPRAGPCVSVVTSLVLPAGESSVPLSCCTKPDGRTCLPDYTSAYGAVALVPTKLSAACPLQILAPTQYSGYLSDPSGNTTGTADVAGLGGLYTAGVGCGKIQVAVSRLCSPIGGGKEDLSTCEGGIAAVQGGMSRLVACPKGAIQPTRRLVMPSDITKVNRIEGPDGCRARDISVDGPVLSVAINATKDGTPTPCASQPLTELLYYRCNA